MQYQIDNYIPHSNAKKLHHTKAKEVILIAPTRSGKTYSLIFDIITKAWNDKSGYATLIAAPAYWQVDLLQIPIHEKLAEYGLEKSYNSVKREIVLKNGNRIYFRTLENPDQSVRGLTLSRAYLDEITYAKKYALDVVRSRLLTTNGPIYLCGTPKGTNSWFYDEFFSETASRHDYQEYIKYNLRDNPTISEDAVERLYEQYDPLLAKQELEAEWVNLTQDRVYRSFDPELNVKEEDMNRRAYRLYIGVDYNLDINAYITLQKILDNIYVFEEGYGCKTTQALGHELLTKYGNPNTVIVDDASGHSRQQADGQTNRQILHQCGMTNTLSNIKNPFREARYAVVNAHFLNGKMQRRLFIHPRCKKLINELNTLSYKKDSDHIDDRGGKVGHLTDALGYAVFYLSGGNVPYGQVRETYIQ